MARGSRTGRKRKSGRRYPNGELNMGPHVDIRQFVANQPHRRMLLPADRTEPIAFSFLGRLLLGGKITKEQHLAGDRYAAIVNRYRAVIGAPSPEGARLLEVGGILFISDEEARRRKSAYDDAFEALCEAGQKAARAVAHVAVYGKHCDELDRLVAGLERLVRHFGLVVRRGGVDSAAQIMALPK